jgi:hypothetical protein
MRPLFLVLAKLTGLLHLYWTLGGIVQMFVLFGTMGSIGPGKSASALIPSLGFAAYVALALGLTWILLAKTDWLADKLGIPADAPMERPTHAVLLRVGIQLIGAFAIVQALPALARALVSLQQTGGLTSRFVHWHSGVAPLVQLALGLFLAFRANTIAARLDRSSVPPVQF